VQPSDLVKLPRSSIRKGNRNLQKWRHSDRFSWCISVAPTLWRRETKQ